MSLGRPLPRADVRHQGAGAGYPIWVLIGQVLIGFFIFIDFNTIKGINPQPRFALTILMIGAMVMFSPRGTIGRTRISASVWLLVGWWLLSYAWTTGTYQWISITTTQVGSILAMTVVASVLPRPRLDKALLVSVYAMTVYTYLYTAVTPGATITNDAATGAISNVGWHGPFNHKNNLASFMVVAMLLVLTLESEAWRRRLAVTAMALLVVLSRSGTGNGGMFAAIAVYFLMRRVSRESARRGGALLSGWLLTALVTIGVGSVFLPSLLRLYGKDPTLTGRTDIWAGVWPAIRARPWTGYGWGGVWSDPSREPTFSILRRIGFIVFHSHNGALEIMLELGVVGLALMSCVFGSTAAGGWRLLRIEPALGCTVVAYCMLVLASSVTEVLVTGPWLTWLVFFRALSMRVIAEHDEGAIAEGGQASSSRPFSRRASAASAMARNGRPARVATSTSERVPSDWLSTQSTPISTERASMAPPIAE